MIVMNRVYVAAVLMGCAGALRADFTYQQTTQVTGGAMVEMLKLAGPFARQAREPQVSTVIVKGNRMATVRKDQTTVIDLDKETVTEIDNAKKQYSVVTFQQMKQAMEDAIARAQQQKGKQQDAASTAEANVKVNAKATGQTKSINGISAREVVVEMAMEATDKQTGKSGDMTITLDNWLGDVPGYQEVQAFHRKMGEKMGYTAGSAMAQMPMMRPEMMKGLEAAGKEMAKVQGAAVQSIMKMSMTGDGSDIGSQMQQARQQQAQQQQQQTRQQPPPQSATDAAVGAALGRFGIGGIGRNRNKGNDQKQQPPAEAAPAPAADAAPAPAGSSSLMESTTELTSFSQTADGSKFDAPAGYKQVESAAGRLGR